MGFPTRNLRHLTSVLLLIPVISLGLMVTRTQGVVTGDPLVAVDGEYQEGRLTLDERVILQLEAIFHPEHLPTGYREPGDQTVVAGSRAASPALLDICRNRELLLDETQKVLEMMLVRPETEFSWVSPEGGFRLHYDTAVADTHAVPVEDSDGDGIPDFVEKCAAYCDTTRATHQTLGYFMPPSDGELGGDSLYDVYFRSMIYFGVTIPEGPGPQPWNDNISYLIMHNTYEGFRPNQDPEGQVWGAAKATAAHEFHHAVQYAYDVGEADWFMEMDAVFMEDIIFDATNDGYNYLPNFFDAPETTLMKDGYHAYSTFIYPLFLTQLFDTSLMRAAWEGGRYGEAFEVLGDTLAGRYGWQQDSAFAEFTVWNYCTAGRDDGQHHEEAPFYPYVDVAAVHSNYPVLSHSSPVGTEGYGCCYVEFYPGNDSGDFEITFDGSDSREWAVHVVVSTTESQHEFYRLSLDELYQSGVFELIGFENYDHVTLIGANTSEFSTGAYFSYSAEVSPPYSVASQVLTTDSLVYLNGTRAFLYEVTNTSDLNAVFDVFVWDDSGWLGPDTAARAVPAQEADTFSFNVHPPQSTHLNARSTLFFMVRIRNDTTITDLQTAPAMVVLQHGDANASGSINITDVAYLVSYLFGEGAEPIPVIEAADVNCQMPVNVIDLSTMVQYLFGGGDPPPCNPY